jgi:hypothetical protein
VSRGLYSKPLRLKRKVPGSSPSSNYQVPVSGFLAPYRNSFPMSSIHASLQHPFFQILQYIIEIIPTTLSIHTDNVLAFLITCSNPISEEAVADQMMQIPLFLLYSLQLSFDYSNETSITPSGQFLFCTKHQVSLNCIRYLLVDLSDK